MDKAELEQRTKRFALRAIRFVAELPKSKVNDVLGYQLLKSGTSIGANYREVPQGFLSTRWVWWRKRLLAQYWLELSQEALVGNAEERHRLFQESTELLAIFTSIGKTTKLGR